MTAPARFQATVLGEWPVLATRGPLGKGRPPPLPTPVGRTICIATSSLPRATRATCDSRGTRPCPQPGPPRARLSSPSLVVACPLGAVATRPTRVFPERLVPWRPREVMLGGQNTSGGGVMKYNLSNQSLVIASQCIVDNGGWLKNVYLGDPVGRPWWVLGKCLLGQVIGSVCGFGNQWLGGEITFLFF